MIVLWIFCRANLEAGNSDILTTSLDRLFDSRKACRDLGKGSVHSTDLNFRNTRFDRQGDITLIYAWRFPKLDGKRCLIDWRNVRTER